MAKKTPSKPLRIEEIDRNFKNQVSAETLIWVDAWDRRIAIRGMGWLKEAKKARSFRRLPDRAADRLTPAVQSLSKAPTGVFLSFFTDSPDLSVRIFNADAVPMLHMPMSGSAGAELYQREGNEWVPIATAIPGLDNAKFERVLFQGRSRKRREYRLYLGLYKHLESVSIGIAPRSKVEANPAPEGSRPIFFYGTSITQGGCANTAGSDFVSLVGRMLDTDTINFGFSGNGKGEPEVAELIREVDAEMFVLDYVANCSPELLRCTLPDFLRILREKRPSTPVVLTSNIGYNGMLWNKATRDLLSEKRDVIMRFYLDAKAAGDTNLYFIDGPGLLPPGLSGTFVDGSHPTSAGFALMAERLAPQLRAILSWYREGLES